MRYADLTEMIRTEAARLAKGPIAVVMVEDDVEVDTTLRHHQQLGFRAVIGLMPPSFELPLDLEQSVIRVDYDTTAENAMSAAVNALMAPLLLLQCGVSVLPLL